MTDADAGVTALFRRVRGIERYEPPGMPLPGVHRSVILPRLTWDAEAVEDVCAVRLPADLTAVWTRTSGMVLFQDIEYGQWGFVLWSPDQTMVRHRRFVQRRPREFVAGDLIVGEFLGDEDLLVVRGDPAREDFGTVLVALPMDPRAVWPRVAMSTLDFLMSFVDAKGEKYWESGRSG